MKDYYKTLEVHKDASPNIISKVYKYLIKENHPDLFSGKQRELAEIKIKELNEAYEILSDSIKRKEYDEMYDTENNSYDEYIEKLETENRILKSRTSYVSQRKAYEDEPLKSENKIENMNDLNLTTSYFKYLFQKVVGTILLFLAAYLIIVTIL